MTMDEEVQVVQLNMNRSNLAAVALNERLKTLKGKYICLLTEPFRYKDRLASMPQRCHVVPDLNTVRDPRASIISNLELIEISALCTKDSAVAIIKHRGGKYLLVSLYMDINLEIRGEHVSNILSYAAKMNIPLLIGADTNSHTTLFGPDSNRRGVNLEELILNDGLRVENIGMMPTYETIRGNKLIRTCIDATLSRDLEGKITSWSVDNEYNGSDHNTVLFKLSHQAEDKKEERNWNEGR